jgi:hypothetical protein
VAIILKPENLARFVFFIRSEKVMLDSDLATLYVSRRAPLIRPSQEIADVFQPISCFS